MKSARLRPFVVVLSIAAASSAAGQYAESVEVRLQNVDAVVTDRQGNPVRGLTKEDFVVRENGVEQPLTNFAAYDSAAAATTPVAVAAPADTASLTDVDDRTPPPRRFVFFIDEIAIQAAARKKLKEHALAIVRQMRPGDVAAVVRPSGAAKMIQDYTGDTALLEKVLGVTIDQCKLRMNAPVLREIQALRHGLESADNANEVIAVKRTYVAAASARVEQRLGQLRALVTSMSGSPGRKILVLITSGLSSYPGREVYSTAEQVGLIEMPHERQPSDAEVASGQNPAPPPPAELLGPMARLKRDLAEAERARAGKGWQGMERILPGDLRGQIDALSKMAAAEGITIYALEPEIPLTLSMTRGADSQSVGSTLTATHVGGRDVVPREMLTQLLSDSGHTLDAMTETTGGRWFRGIGSIDDAFAQLDRDLGTYYSLAYRAGPGSGKSRSIEVGVRGRPGLIVRSRRESAMRSDARSMPDRLLAGLVYPEDANDLAMTVTTSPARKKGRSWIVPVEIVIPAWKLGLERGADGKWRGAVTVHYATAREGREFVSFGNQEQVIELTDAQLAELQRIRYRYRSDLTLPRGDLKIAFGVTDVKSRQSSVQTVSVSVE